MNEKEKETREAFLTHYKNAMAFSCIKPEDLALYMFLGGMEYQKTKEIPSDINETTIETTKDE